ncbi:hypothetical protein M0R04_08545 [Candidatus Dojkabacteria bacterium]|jgi:hypothetical protein|nr:hypothetical protein [Candidatus Dojkabacteria bacterium]
MNKFWTTWVEGSMGGYGHQHLTRELANQEAERIALQPANQGKKVYVLELVGCCENPKPPVNWIAIAPFDEIPF